MKTAGLLGIAILSLVSLGCATVPGPNDPPPARVAGEWTGTATVGPRIGCCFGAAGPVTLRLDQQGTAASGYVVGIGWRGRVSARVTATELWGSCDCETSSLGQNVSIDGAISGNDMVFRVRDARMNLSRTP